MVALQILSKCLANGNISIIEDNQLTEDYFRGYEDEFNFIVNHYKEYGNTPDTATFLSKFDKDDVLEVTESDAYLVKTIREEWLYGQSVPVVQKIAKLLETDANAAVEYMLHALETLQPEYDLGGIDIVAEGQVRYDEWLDRKNNPDKWFFTTGFPELDDVIHGLKRIEEFVLIYARVNIGKSWILEKIITHVWELGFNVGYLSPEMGSSSIGYRFDTLHAHIDNTGLTRGTDDVPEDLYQKYIDNLAENKHRFIVSTPQNFDGKITKTKLKNWVKKFKLDAIAIDGVTYLTDERARRTDSKSDQLTHIGEDLMALSNELGIPVLAVAQANRTGITDAESDDMPDVGSIRDSDGLSFNASKIIALKQTKDGDMMMQVQKGRECRVGAKLSYKWTPNLGEYTYIATTDSKSSHNHQRNDIPKREKKKVEKEDLF